jgi:hypothetical protein
MLEIPEAQRQAYLKAWIASPPGRLHAMIRWPSNFVGESANQINLAITFRISKNAKSNSVYILLKIVNKLSEFLQEVTVYIPRI